MKKTLRQKIGFCALLAVGMAMTCPFTSWSAETRVVATLDKTQMAVGEDAFLTVRILDGKGNIQAPDFPPIRDLDIHYAGRASRMTLVNGVSSSSLDFSYIVSPRRAGSYTIPALAISVGGATLQTQPLGLQVQDSGGYAQAPSSSGANTVPLASQTVKPSNAQPPAGADNRIFAEAQLSKKTVYQNEQVLLNYALFTSFDTRYEGFETEPELSGFWIEEFPMEKEVPREMVSINGRRYIKAEIKKVALFPTAPGKYTIQPGKIKTTIKQDQQQDSVFDDFFNDSFFNGGNFFSKRETRVLSPRPLEIEVKPLPEAGKPKNFQGDVGRYQMNATLDRGEVTQNEPVKMTLVIEGAGNVDRVNRPTIPDLKGFRTYEADSKSEISRTQDSISGRKTFEVVFIPKDEGKMFIPPLEFSFFDPVQGQYQTLRTPNFPLMVLKGEAGPDLPEEVISQPELKKNVQVEGKDIRYVETRIPVKNVFQKVQTAGTLALAGINILLAALFGFFVYQKKQETYIAQNRGAYRFKKAKSVVMSEINALKKLVHEKDIASQNEFFDYLEKSMNQYFADKWNLSAFGTTRFEIDRRLRQEFGAKNEICQEVMDIYHLCDESRFGRGMIPESSKELALRVFGEVVQLMEKKR